MKKYSYSVRLKESEFETLNQVEKILIEQGFEIKERDIMKLVILLGVKVVSLRFEKGENIFDELDY